MAHSRDNHAMINNAIYIYIPVNKHIKVFIQGSDGRLNDRGK